MKPSIVDEFIDKKIRARTHGVDRVRSWLVAISFMHSAATDYTGSQLTARLLCEDLNRAIGLRSTPEGFTGTLENSALMRERIALAIAEAYDIPADGS